MHPNPKFGWADEEGVLAFVAATGFAHIFAITPAGPMLAHAPVVRGPGRALRFHLARANWLTPQLDGARVLLSVAGAEGYVSPNWYEHPADQVPTWNYVAAEVEGAAHAIDEDALVAQLDALAVAHEPRVSPENPWTRDKMDEARFRGMLTAIRGFELRIETVRANRKLGQNKSAADLDGALVGLERSGNRALAAAMRAARG